MKQSGGHITVYSELDHGTTFKVYLRAAGRREEGARAAGEAAPVAGGQATVFLVEDVECGPQLARHGLVLRGLPVLVEKPFALSVQEAGAVAELAARRGVPVVVGHLLLFHPAIERLRAMVTQGELGEIYYLYSQRVNLGQVRPDENALWSFGPHDIAVATYLLDAEPARVASNHGFDLRLIVWRRGCAGIRSRGPRAR